jgi:multidrug efflux system membrane fusion protein
MAYRAVQRAGMLALLALGLPGCGAEPARAHAAVEVRAEQVRLSPVQRGPLALPVRAAGTLGAQHVLELSFKVGGVVTAVPHDEGARIKKGQLLAMIDPTELAAQLTQARQSLEKAQRDRTRIEALQQSGTLPLVDAQNAATGLAVAQTAVDALAFNLHHTRLLAPESGVLDSRLVHVGEMVAPGRTVFRISTSGHGPVARVGLTDREVLSVKLGDRARVRLDARPEQALAAHVTELASSAARGTGTFPVELTVDDPRAVSLPSGLTVKVEIEHEEADVTRVPVSALVDADGREAAVYAVRDQRARRIPVVVRELLGDSVLLATPLPDIDAVVSTGATLLHDGSDVLIVP